MSDYLFVYGTLQPEHAPHEIAHAVEKLQSLGEGSIHGVLYDLGGHPGAVLDQSSTRIIFGTVFRMPDNPDVLSELDEYEEYDPLDPKKSLFIRSLSPVALATGSTLQCWVYTYNRDPGTAPVLASGRYRSTQVNGRTETDSPK